MKKAIIGYGGFAKEVYWSLPLRDRDKTTFFVDDYYVIEGALPLSSLDINEYEVIVAIANPKVRHRIVSSLPPETRYFTHIHHSVQIHGDDVTIGEGSIICAGSIITCNVKIGNHAQVNLLTTIGHDNVIGDFFTTAPGVQISGNETIGDRVYFGARSCIKEKLKVCNDVIIGMNSGVVKDITEPGTYIGTPAKILL
jgi:sugar O-acyltransferase (sialic acid O-acetyltransferase NeuD family)